MVGRMRLDDQDKRALRALDSGFTIAHHGEIAWVEGKMEVGVMRPDDYGGGWCYLVIRFPGGKVFEVRIARAQLLEPARCLGDDES
jgi:hypothetical protein